MNLNKSGACEFRSQPCTSQHWSDWNDKLSDLETLAIYFLHLVQQSNAFPYYNGPTLVSIWIRTENKSTTVSLCNVSELMLPKTTQIYRESNAQL